MRPQRIEPGPGQESVWDYPRPPALVRTTERVRIVHRGVTVADTTAAWRVLETSQPPAYYLPRIDIDDALLTASPRRSLCEWKGMASYWSLTIGGPDNVDVNVDVDLDVAWSYEDPTPGFVAITGHLAFYAQAVDECWVDDERVVPNPGSFYGGWITSRVVGPFKGAAGTLHW